jgi:hypothetical protein
MGARVVIGPRIGPRVGPAIGQLSSGYAFADSGSGILCPTSAADFTALGLVPPTSLWLFQESGAGDRADSIGSRTFAPTGAGFTHAVPVPGWARVATVLGEGLTNRYDAAIANTNVTDFLILLYASVADPASTRNIIETPTIYAEINTTPRLVAEANSAVVGTVDPGTAVHPLVLKNWIGNSRGLLTDDEALEPVEFANAGTAITLGATGGNGTAGVSALYGAMWEGVTARMSNATIKSMLQALGWTVAW